jgi:hypothetical protein
VDNINVERKKERKKTQADNLFRSCYCASSFFFFSFFFCSIYLFICLFVCLSVYMHTHVERTLSSSEQNSTFFFFSFLFFSFCLFFPSFSYVVTVFLVCFDINCVRFLTVVFSSIDYARD